MALAVLTIGMYVMSLTGGHRWHRDFLAHISHALKPGGAVMFRDYCDGAHPTEPSKAPPLFRLPPPPPPPSPLLLC